jgi:hypothetical protein
MRVVWIGVALVAAATACGCDGSASMPVAPSSVGGDNGGGGAGGGGGTGGVGGGGSGGIGGGGSGGVGGGGSGGVGGGGSGCNLTAPATLVSGLHVPKKIAVDATDIYYVDAAGPGGLYRVAKSGGTPALLALVGSMQTDTFDWDLAVDDTTIYLLHGGRQTNPSSLDAGSIELIYKSGAASRLIPAQSSGCHTAFPHTLAVVAGQLYWRQTDVVNPDTTVCGGLSSTYRIIALDPATFDESVLAQTSSGSALTVDPFHVFFSDVDGTHRTPRTPDGGTDDLAPLALDALVTDGNTLFGFHMTDVWAITAPNQYRAIAAGSQQVQGLALDDTHLYFGTVSGVRRIDKDGGDPRLITDGDASAPTVDATRVYYFSGGNLMTACK